jgi:diacylglycerol kinase family enzyme
MISDFFLIFVEIEGPFFVVHACNMPWMAGDALLAPDSKPNDGFVYVNIMKKSSRLKYLKAFLDFETGKHVYHDNVMIIKCREFGIIPEPLTPYEQSTNTGGCYVIDGNLVSSEYYRPLTAKVIPSIVPMYCNTNTNGNSKNNL